MSKILNFMFSHYAGLFFAGVVFVSAGTQASPAGALDVAFVEIPESQPSTEPATGANSETPPQTQPIAIKHLSKREAQLVRELHRHGIYW
jgi:hypothetical protein